MTGIRRPSKLGRAYESSASRRKQQLKDNDFGTLSGGAMKAKKQKREPRRRQRTAALMSLEKTEKKLQKAVDKVTSRPSDPQTGPPRQTKLMVPPQANQRERSLPNGPQPSQQLSQQVPQQGRPSPAQVGQVKRNLEHIFDHSENFERNQRRLEQWRAARKRFQSQ